MAKRKLTVALTGNPNSGKSTIFNVVTGARQTVGNYPGVTVEKTQGVAVHEGVGLTVVDLPGTYSLTAQSLDEVVARDFILDTSPDVVVDIIDSSNLERSLYLAVQLMEVGAPLVLAFNMSDLARGQGYDIQINVLSELLGVPIVETTASKGQGIGDLLDCVVRVAEDAEGEVGRHRLPRYGHEVEPHVAELAGMIADACGSAVHNRWFAVKLLEGDERTIHRLRHICPGGCQNIVEHADRLRRHIRSVCGDSAEIILADRRYGYISGACAEAVSVTVASRHDRSDQIDAILTNRYLGLPIFAVLMYSLFQLTFVIGNPIVGWLDVGKEHLAAWVRSLGSPDSLLISLLADGVIEGVGAVIVFLPLIVLLYLGISILQDSGYMARAAFVLDSLMHRIGLHGKSFIPMLIGFGCTVPAVMATRILDTRRDRLTTLMVLPLMSCGARLPVYVLIIGALFPAKFAFGSLEVGTQGAMLFGIYAIGIVLAIICAKILRRTVFRGEAGAFVMELPPYRLPAMKGVLVHTWERAREYVKKAGTIILAIVVVLWALKTWPMLPAEQKEQYNTVRSQILAESHMGDRSVESRLAQVDADEHRDELLHSAIGRVGRAMAPALSPCGLDWKASTAILGSMAAKEVFVGQMGVIYAVTDAESDAGLTLRSKLAESYTPLQGVSIMLFILISSPCVATVAVTVRESGSWKWAVMQWGYLTVLAWVVCIIVYQVFSALGVGAGLSA